MNNNDTEDNIMKNSGGNNCKEYEQLLMIYNSTISRCMVHASSLFNAHYVTAMEFLDSANEFLMNITILQISFTRNI